MKRFATLAALGAATLFCSGAAHAQATAAPA
ncbi:MAG: ArtI protein, partial [Burkholderia vietnamiensis]|nr:ArtI protein [Burkholderia vietnamiensis]